MTKTLQFTEFNTQKPLRTKRALLAPNDEANEDKED